MKILIVNTYFYPETVGGTETLLLTLAEEYVRRGHDVAVYCLEGTGRELLRENIRGIRVFRGAAGKTVFDDPLSLIGKADRWLSKAYNLRIKKEMETVLDEFSPDVVHTNNLFYMSTRVWKIAYDRHIPVMHTLHDYYLMTRDTLPFRLLYRFHRLNVKYISCFTGPSSVIVREFVEDGLFEGRTGLMIPNGIPMDREMFRKYRAQKLERSESDPVVFLYAGQLTKEKGIGEMMDAWSGLDLPDIRLLICGKGPLEELCRSRAASDPRISMLGFLPQEELEEIYCAADVLIAPSVWKEPFGMVSTEALYHAMPVIVGKTGGMPATVEHVRCGVVVDGSDSGMIRRCLLGYTSRSRVKQDICRIGEGLFDYDIAIQAERFLSLYRELSVQEKND